MGRMRKKRLENEEYRVYGPPGTGKTTWISKAVTKAAEMYGEDQVSICSLTKTAVSEVVGRDLPLDPDNMTTLHARCKRSLSAPGPAEAKIKQFIKDCPAYAGEGTLPPGLIKRSDPLEEEEGEGNLSEVIFSSSREPTLYERAQILRQQMVPKAHWPHEVLQWFRVWDDWCRQNGRMDFTGWLEAALEVDPLPSQQMVFVDEAQDHTPLQLAVIRTWNTKARVLVGDDDQNLYEWSGALPQFFFEPELPADREKVLAQSYRVPKAVHRMAMRWVLGVSKRKQKDYMPRDHEGVVTMDRYSIADADDGMLPPRMLEDPDRTYMVLATCGYMLDGIVSALKSRGIPFHNPYRRSNLKWNPLATVGPKIRGYLVKDRLWSGFEAYEWAKVLKAKGVYREGQKDKFLELCEEKGSGLLTMDDLRGHFLPGMLDRILSRDLRVLRDFRRVGVPGQWAYGLEVYSKDPAEWESRVIVGTVHSVKGGEADCVYLFPELSPSGFMDYLGNGRDRVMRLMYVGMTRSRDQLVLCDRSNRFAVDW